MKKKMEILNLVTGAELFVIGVIYFFLNDISSAASWGVFGCMYIVMDKYTIIENASKKRKYVDLGKYAFAWLGFFVSSSFLLYLVFNF